MEIRGEKLDEESDLVRPLFIINDMISPTVSFRANDIHKVYHMFQTALEQAGHLQHFKLHPRGEDHVGSTQCRGLDGYSFFGLNLNYVVIATELQENSIYHAIPPAGFVVYNYHQEHPKGEQIIRVRHERVLDSEGIHNSSMKRNEARKCNNRRILRWRLKLLHDLVLPVVDVFLLRRM